jgi:hypothetical protein
VGSLRARGLGVVWSPDWGDVKGGKRKWQAVRWTFCQGGNSLIMSFIMGEHRPPSVGHPQILVPLVPFNLLVLHVRYLKTTVSMEIKYI